MDQNAPTNIMIPGLNFDSTPPKLTMHISPAHNGFSVYIEEAIKVKRTLTIKDLEKKIGPIQQSINKSMSTGDPVLDKVRRERPEMFGGKAPEDEKNEPEIPLGLYIFTSLQELISFVTFIYENHEKELQDKANKMEELRSKLESK